MHASVSVSDFFSASLAYPHTPLTHEHTLHKRIFHIRVCACTRAQGFPALGISCQAMENRQLREYYRMTSDDTGVLVCKVLLFLSTLSRPLARPPKAFRPQGLWDGLKACRAAYACATACPPLTQACLSARYLFYKIRPLRCADYLSFFMSLSLTLSRYVR